MSNEVGTSLQKKRVSLNDFAWLFMGAGRKKLQFLASVTEVLQLSLFLFDVGLIQFGTVPCKSLKVPCSSDTPCNGQQHPKC